MRKRLWPLLLAGCAGAGSAHDGAADNRRTVTADLGTPSFIGVPDSVRERPVFSPNVLSLGKDGVEEGSLQRTLEFTARTLGETELRIGADCFAAGPGPVGVGAARHAHQSWSRVETSRSTRGQNLYSGMTRREREMRRNPQIRQ